MAQVCDPPAEILGKGIGVGGGGDGGGGGGSGEGGGRGGEGDEGGEGGGRGDEGGKGGYRAPTQTSSWSICQLEAPPPVKSSAHSAEPAVPTRHSYEVPRLQEPVRMFDER